MKLLIIAAALAVSSGAATAAATNAQPSKGKAAATRSLAYCYDVERTGSYIVRRVCQTEKDWNAEGIQVPRK